MISYDWRSPCRCRLLLIAGDLSLKHIVESRPGILGCFSGTLSGSVKTYGFTQIIGCICFFIAASRKPNRVPFDLPEAESELVAGFHTEYASMKFAMFLSVNYTSMIGCHRCSRSVFWRLAVTLPCPGP